MFRFDCTFSNFNCTKRVQLHTILRPAFTHFRYFQTPSENSPFKIAHQHPYHAAHLVIAGASDSASLLNVCAL